MKSPLNRSLRTSLLFFLISSTTTTQAELIRRGQSKSQDEDSFSSVQQQRELGGRHRGAYQPSGGSLISTKSNNDGPTQTKKEALKEKNASKKTRCTLAIREVQLVDQASYEQIDCLPQSGVTVHVVKGLSSQWVSSHRGELLDGQISAQVPEKIEFDSPVTSDMNFDDEFPSSEATMTITESDLTIDPSQSLRERHRHLQQHIGVKRVLAVRVQARDSVNTYSLNALRKEVFGIDSKGNSGADPVNLKTQMEACSYDALKIEPAQGEGIVNGVYNSNIGINAKNKDDGYARNAVIAEMSKKFSWFDGWSWINTDVAHHVMICIPPGTSGGWIGYAWPNYYVSVYNDKWCLYPSIQMHEVGHNLNLAHSGQGSNAYGDQSGMMGYSYGYDDWPAMCFNSAKSWQLGWYEGKRMEFAPISSHTRTLKLYGITRYEEIQSNDEDEQVLIRIKGGTSKDYYVGFNRKERFNRHTVEGANSVLIVQKTKDSERYDSTQLVASLGAVGNSWSNQDFGGSGETFRLTVSDINLDAGYAEITLVGFQESPPPTVPPTPSPTNEPTESPTESPTVPPTPSPTNEPTASPTVPPTPSPTSEPTTSPTVPLTPPPTGEPTTSPTVPPTLSPTSEPTTSPTVPPTPSPTSEPTTSPTVPPTLSPTSEPTTSPTVPPTPSPTSEPTTSPTVSPTSEPTTSPTVQPTSAPIIGTAAPTISPQPTNEPTPSPTNEPTVPPTQSPTNEPTPQPTNAPTSPPTNGPTVLPTQSPTNGPTQVPTLSPTSVPTEPPTLSPTSEPTVPPTTSPTNEETVSPTSTPTNPPTPSPTNEPTAQPTPSPTPLPTFETGTDTLLNMTMIVSKGTSSRRELQQEEPQVMSSDTLSHIISRMEAYLEMSFASAFENTIYASSNIHCSLRATATSGESTTTKLRQRQLQEDVNVELSGTITMAKDALSADDIDAKQQEYVSDVSSVEQAMNAERSEGQSFIQVSSSTAANPTTLAPTSIPTPAPTPAPTTKPTPPPTPKRCGDIKNRRQCKRSRLRCKWKRRTCRGKKRRLGEEEQEHFDDYEENGQSVWDDDDEGEDYDDDAEDILFDFGSEKQDYYDYDDEEDFEDEEREEFLVITG